MNRNPYTPPEANVDDVPGVATPATRGGCLITFLVLVIVANTVLAVVYFTQAALIASQLPRLSEGFVFALGAVGLLNVFLASLVWRWRRVGVYGFVSVSLLVFALNLYVGLPVLQAAAGLLGPLILILLVRGKWSHFR